MTDAWYNVLSLSFGYVSCAMAILLALLALKTFLRDRRTLRRVRRTTPRVGHAGTLRVLSSGHRRLSVGTNIPVPYEGTLGALHSCDVCIPQRRVHLRSAFFWMEGDGLHMVALHRDGFVVDEVPVEPGDEAILEDGAVLEIGAVRLVWRMKDGKCASFEPVTGPYVTGKRKSRAQQGRGDGLGAPGKGEARREKKQEKKREEKRKKQARIGVIPPADAPKKRTRKKKETD